MVKNTFVLATLLLLGIGGLRAQALQDAILKSDTALVLKLLEKGEDANAADKNGSTPLMVACRWGNTPMVRILLEHGATADAPRTPKGRTPLMVACAYYSGPDVCGLLLKAGANVNATSDDGATALMFAATNCKVEVVNLLLQQKAQPLAKDKKGQTALDYANQADYELIKNSMGDQRVNKQETIDALKAAMGQ